MFRTSRSLEPISFPYVIRKSGLHCIVTKAGVNIAQYINAAVAPSELFHDILCPST